MPYKPMHPCRQPGCPVLVPAGQKYCDKHQAMHAEEIRPAARRGYGRQWKKASKAFLQSHPLCEECLRNGRYTKAMVVDHKIPHRGDPELFWDQDNWQALCKQCHDRKTRTQDETPVYHY